MQNSFNLLAEFYISRKPEGKNPKKHLGLRSVAFLLLAKLENIMTSETVKSWFRCPILGHARGSLPNWVSDWIVHKTLEGVP